MSIKAESSLVQRLTDFFFSLDDALRFPPADANGIILRVSNRCYVETEFHLEEFFFFFFLFTKTPDFVEISLDNLLRNTFAIITLFFFLICK